ncbi:MAG: GtrA family protein [Hyalangium sp.]|uniref:GtrA family protein n=1 Tax=Hyalangium sp. TaxID=2028555 RepID=UPI0038999D42
MAEASPGGTRHEVWKFIKGQLSSGLATIVDWGLMSSLIALGVYYLYAAAAGALAGALTDFSVKKWWVFQAGVGAGSLHGQALRYALVSAASAGLNVLLSYGLVDGLGAPKVPGVIGASIVIGFVWNYPLHRLYVFRRRYSPT